MTTTDKALAERIEQLLPFKDYVATSAHGPIVEIGEAVLCKLSIVERDRIIATLRSSPTANRP
jgi:hypothetical protein